MKTMHQTDEEHDEYEEAECVEGALAAIGRH